MKNFLLWLKESYQYLLLLIFLITIILFLIFYFFWRRISQKRKELENSLSHQKKWERILQNKQREEEVASQKMAISIERLKSVEKRLEQEQKRIENSTNQLLRKEELFTQQLREISQKEKNVQEEREKLQKIQEKVIDDLAGTISLSREEVKKYLFTLLKEEVDQRLERYKEEKIKQMEKNVKEEGTKMICLALERYSSELVFSKTTDTLQVENRQIISKVIGREGRNINTFRRITGTEVIIDKEGDLTTIQISSFNSLRRETALQTMRTLLSEEKFSPQQVEQTYQKVSSEINDFVIHAGEEVLKSLELNGIHPELVKHLGRLKYRTSYGQNVLEHCLEVAKLAGSIAAELGLEVALARRAGLFHDIGKSVEDKEGYSHVLSGVDLAKKYKEPAVVINAIASHHRDFPADNFYSLIILAADRLSAARPGARGYQLEAYIERMNSLENIAKEFEGVEQSYAFQAGREIWVIANAEKLSDYQTWEVSQKIKEKIKKSIIIPGEVNIYVVREKRFIQKLNGKKRGN